MFEFIKVYEDLNQYCLFLIDNSYLLPVMLDALPTLRLYFVFIARSKTSDPKDEVPTASS